jgi:AcrR family transcriptional regulator
MARGSATTANGIGRKQAAITDADAMSTRERIVRSAAELFAKQGYHATGISELLAAAELSRGAFYYHIDGKETLLFEISRTQVEQMNAVAAVIAASEAPARERMRLLAQSLIRNISDHHAEWVVFFREFDALEGERREEILAAREQYEQYWLRVLRDGAASREFVKLSRLQVKGILGMLNYTYLWIDPNGRLKPEQIADTFVDLLLEGICTR